MSPTLPFTTDLIHLLLGAGVTATGIAFSGISYFGETTRRSAAHRITPTAVGVVAALLFALTLVFGLGREYVDWQLEQKQQAQLDRATESIEEAAAFIRAQSLLSMGVTPADQPGYTTKSGVPSAPAPNAAAVLQNLEATLAELRGQ